jgi:hypothetical protein
MRELQQNIVKVMIAGIGLTALYDVLSINKGRPLVDLTKTIFGGYGAILARGSGQKPPAGF